MNVVSYGYESGSNLIGTRTVKVNGSQVMQEQRDYDALRQLTSIATTPGRSFGTYDSVGRRSACVVSGFIALWLLGFDPELKPWPNREYDPATFLKKGRG